MGEVTIFVEGLSDQKFVRDLIQFFFNKKLNLKSDIRSFDGKDKWQLTKAEFEKSTQLGNKNVLIFDADRDPKTRREELLRKKTELGIEFELFLLPNNSNSGELEDLLHDLVTEKALPIFECFENYKKCVLQINDNYSSPDIKGKVYAYSEAVSDRKANYLDGGNWNLKHDSLNPLVDFLKRHLENEA